MIARITSFLFPFYASLNLFIIIILCTVNLSPIIPVERYSESESQIGNSGSEDNCNFNNSNTISSNNKETSGKNHTSVQAGYTQNNGTVSNPDSASTPFSNGPISNGNIEHVPTPIKDCHNNSKDSNKTKSTNSAKKNSNKRSRNR
ncbi:hypothetical protein M0804_008113 [Polistes exclamans]|nr:hypothetical protein M0804_008113 [Polistes exclamans]